MNFFTCLFQEALRADPPGQISTTFVMTKTARVGKYTLRKDDRLRVHYWALHHNPNEWQRPFEFLPDRWDPSSPLYLTPSGGKRNPYSYSPFSGGRRVCLGKTFADYTARTVANILYYKLEMQFVDQKFLTSRPVLHVVAADIPVLLKVTARN